MRADRRENHRGFIPVENKNSLFLNAPLPAVTNHQVKCFDRYGTRGKFIDGSKKVPFIIRSGFSQNR